MLHIHGATRTWPGSGGPVLALAPIDLRVAGGELVALRGPSGSGKSTLLLACAGLLGLSGGRIEVDGRDLARLGAAELDRLRARRIGFVFQRLHLIPYLDVLDNIRLPALAAGMPGDDGRCAALLDRFGLGGRRHHRPHQLSIGERQRTALARALAPAPGLILADEPTGSLDAGLGAVVLDALAEAAADGAAVLVATHDDRVAARMHRQVALRPGGRS
ncbi:MAG: hypothetical protein RLZZ127_2860 [Planctomycetota bacterium]|jgi:putative ABC transport system ATP-binding protein